MARSPLQLPNFRWLWLGQTLILSAVQFWLVALTWLVLQMTGSGVAIGTVLMAAAIPRTLFTLIGGALSDRVQPNRIASLSGWTNTLLVAIVAALLWFNALRLSYLIAIAVLLGLSDAFLYPATLSMLPRLIDKSLLVKANTLMQGGEQITNAIGPAAAGLAISRFGLPIAFAIDAALFAIGSSLLLLVRQRGDTTPQSAKASQQELQQLAGEIIAGLRYAWNHPSIRICLLTIAMLNLAALGPLVVGVAQLVELRLGGDAMTYGYLQAAFGIGALFGLLVTSRIGSVKNPTTALIILAIALGVGTITLGFVRQEWMAYSVVLFMGLGVGFLGVIAVSWLQQQTVAQMQGRIMGLLAFTSAALDPFSQAISGFLMDINLTLMFVVAGATMLVTAFLAFLNCTIQTSQKN